jgi:hypothetical protein
MTQESIRRENEDLRRSLGALKLMSLQGDYHGIRDELSGYVIEFDNDGPVVPSRCIGQAVE